MENNLVTTENFLTKAFGEEGLVGISDEVKELYVSLANTIAGVNEGFEEVDTEWRPAIIRVVQAMSSTASGKPESAKIGDLYYKGGLIKRPFHAAVVYGWPTRVRFTNEDKVPSCSSENVDSKGKGALDKSISIYGDACAKCPFDDQPFRHGKPTPCNDVMNVLLVPEDLSNIFVMPFSKTAYSAGRQIVTLASAKRPPWSRFFSIDTTVEKRKGGGGQFAIPNISAIDEKELAVPDHLQKFCGMLSEHFKTFRQNNRARVLERASMVNDKVDMDTLDVPRGGKTSKEQDFSDEM